MLHQFPCRSLNRWAASGSCLRMLTLREVTRHAMQESELPLERLARGRGWLVPAVLPSQPKCRRVREEAILVSSPGEDSDDSTPAVVWGQLPERPQAENCPAEHGQPTELEATEAQGGLLNSIRQCNRK